MLWYFQILHLNTFYKYIKKNELSNASETLLNDIYDEDLEDVMTEIANDYDLGINLTDSEGNSIYSVNVPTESHIYIMDDFQFQDLYNHAMENGGSITYEVDGRYRYQPSASPEDLSQPLDGGVDQTEPLPLNLQSLKDASEMYNGEGDFNQSEFNASVTDPVTVIYIHVFVTNKGDEYVLLMSSLITPVDATVDTLRIQFIFISLIFVVLALIIAFAISQVVSRPIVKINKTAKLLAQGEFELEFNGLGYREIQELSDTLNYAAKELGRTENLRKDLIANVSHDLRTPLTMITAYAEVMRDLPGENNPENVQVIIDEAKRLTTLVNDMLDLSKIQSGVMGLKAEEFDFTTSILGVLNRFSKLMEQRGYHIEFEYQENIKVYADEYKIYQVIYNLINNAINYAGEDKTVIVRQIVKGDRVRLEVEDHGEGIDADEVNNIWDRYYKVDKTHKRAVQGTGLGLSIVHSILLLHHAEFGVESEKGKGSIFWFEILREKTNE